MSKRTVKVGICRKYETRQNPQLEKKGKEI